jgi:hypothetical protein
VHANGDAPGREEHVGLEPTRDRRAVRVRVVGDRGQAFDLGAGRAELCVEDRPVRLVDLTWPQRLAGCAELAAGCEHGGPRATRARNLGDA